MTASYTKEQVLEALREVVDPTYQKSMVDLGTIQNLAVEDDGKVSFVAEVHNPSEELQETLRTAIQSSLKKLGVVDAEVTWKLQVPEREVVGNDPLPDVKNVILVMSGKGGVGKSTVATNLALAFKRMGTRVGLMDADIYGPSIPTMMGTSSPPFSSDGKLIEPIERFGIKMMSIGFMLEDPKQAVIWRGPMLNSALRQFVNDIAWGELDYLICDFPPGTGDVAISLTQHIRPTGAIMVTTPQQVALDDVYKGVSMCQKIHVPVLGVVENMSGFVDSAGVKHAIFGEGGGQLVADFAKAPLLGQVPIEPEVREWGDKGTPIVQAAPGSAAADVFMGVADKLATRIAEAAFERSGRDKPQAQNKKRLRLVD